MKFSAVSQGVYMYMRSHGFSTGGRGWSCTVGLPYNQRLPVDLRTSSISGSSQRDCVPLWVSRVVSGTPPHTPPPPPGLTDLHPRVTAQLIQAPQSPRDRVEFSVSWQWTPPLGLMKTTAEQRAEELFLRGLHCFKEIMVLAFLLLQARRRKKKQDVKQDLLTRWVFNDITKDWSLQTFI